MSFICSRQTTIQTFQYKITHRILACNDCLNNIKIKISNTCSFCNDKDTISHFPIDCNSNKWFGKSWAKWWEAMTSFNIREESYIHESILFEFPGSSDDAISINYCMLYAKYYIYFKKLKEENKKREFNVDFLGYLCYLEYILKIEKSISNRKNQIAKFDKFNTIFENL